MVILKLRRVFIYQILSKFSTPNRICVQLNLSKLRNWRLSLNLNFLATKPCAGATENTKFFNSEDAI